jgi:hypothetical protein
VEVEPILDEETAIRLSDDTDSSTESETETESGSDEYNDIYTDFDYNTKQ